MHVPIVVNKDGVILDGHHRYKACKELGIKSKTVTKKDFPDKLHEQMFIIDSNLQRRQLNNFQRTELALKSKSILDQIVKRNKSLGGKKMKDDRILTPVGRADEKIGELAGVSRDTVRRVQTIIEKAPEEVKQSLRTGHMSINEVIEQIKKTIDDTEGEGGHEVIIIDDPQLQKLGGSDKTVLTKLGDCRDALRELWKAFTEKESMPHLDEDLLLDHIKPTREYRKFVYELDKDQRAGLHNWIVPVIEVLNDMLEIIEEADSSKK